MRTDAQVFDLLCLGLTWVQENVRDGKVGWTGNGVLQTVRLAGGLDDLEARAIARQPGSGLRAYLHQRTFLAYPGEQGRKKLDEAKGASDKLLVALLHTQLYDSELLVMPRGYKLLVTDRGQEYAHNIASRYDAELPKDAFLAQWRRHGHQMAGLHARTRSLQSER